ncbi:MAG: inorganic diphosphatase [bacterium]
MNLWHDIPRGKDIPNEFNTIIEIPKGSFNKYEIDKETGLIALDRANYSAAPYPFDYGYVPQTLWGDGDPLDVILLTTYPLFPGILVKARPIAVMDMTDTGESDAKIIAVPVDDKRFDDVHDLADLNKHNLKEFTHFWETYKELKKGEKGTVSINGIYDKATAIANINESIKLYDEKYGK